MIDRTPMTGVIPGAIPGAMVDVIRFLTGLRDRRDQQDASQVLILLIPFIL